MQALGVLIVLLALVVVVLLLMGLRIVQQYEQGVVFRLGRVQPGVRQPGITVIIPVLDRMQKVNMQIITMGVPSQECITKDNVSVHVDAVVYFRVIDPWRSAVVVVACAVVLTSRRPLQAQRWFPYVEETGGKIFRSNG